MIIDGRPGVPYSNLRRGEKPTRALWAANAMRALPMEARDAAIAASPNVIDARDKFDQRRNNAILARSYRCPQKPGETA